MPTGSSPEPITFKCDGCTLTSSGLLEFSYYTTREKRREWIIEHEYERTPGIAHCEHCGQRNDVWPRFSYEKRWIKRHG